MPTDIGPELVALEQIRKEGVFQSMRAFATMGIGFRAGDSERCMIFELMPELVKFRALAQARGASMRLASNAHDQNDAADAFDELLAMAQTISYQPSVIFHLVAQSIQTVAVDELRSELMENEFDAEHCRKFLESIERHTLASAKLSLNSERMVFADFVQRVFTDDGSGNGYVDVGGMDDVENGSVVQNRTIYGSYLGRFVLADRRETVACYNSYIDQCIAQCDLVTSKRWKSFSVDAWIAALPSRLKLIGMIAPALQKFVDTSSSTQANLEQLRIMIALQQYRLAHGEFPQRMEALVPDFLSSLPIDASNGQPFAYRLTPDDQLNRPYLLYSLGTDGIDNGGVMHSGRKDGFTGSTKPTPDGVDVIFNAPRQEP